MKSLAAAVLLAAACAREDCPQPKPQALANEGVGEPCGGNGNCAEGLTCRTVYAVNGYESPVFTGNACSAACDAGCPGGSTCASLPGPIDACLRSCSSDGDCLTTRSAGTCDAGFCARLQCTEDDQCPTGFACDVPAIVCCPAGAQCSFSGKVAGYCRRS